MLEILEVLILIVFAAVYSRLFGRVDALEKRISDMERDSYR